MSQKIFTDSMEDYKTEGNMIIAKVLDFPKSLHLIYLN